MFRSSVLGIFALLVSPLSLSAQQWAEKMFSDTNYNFGNVARSAKVEHRFIVKNIYKEDAHIASVRSSCGCTSPRIEKDSLKTYEQGAIVAAFNTNTFTGQHGATVTVTFDKPFYAEVRLRVDGYIRTDVVLDPSQIAFGSVDEGAGAEKTIKINYSGRGDWKISDVKVGSPFLSATAKEISRFGGHVVYELAVKMNPDAPAGYVRDQVLLVTNDRNAVELPVMVEGVVVSDLTVSPSSLMLGILQPLQSVTKQIVVRGKKPFRIVKVECDDPAFSFKTSDEAKTMHLIPVTYQADSNPGKISRKIRIETDLSGKQAELTVYGQVISPLADN